VVDREPGAGEPPGRAVRPPARRPIRNRAAGKPAGTPAGAAVRPGSGDSGKLGANESTGARETGPLREGGTI